MKGGGCCSKHPLFYPSLDTVPQPYNREFEEKLLHGKPCLSHSQILERMTTPEKSKPSEKAGRKAMGSTVNDLTKTARPPAFSSYFLNMKGEEKWHTNLKNCLRWL